MPNGTTFVFTVLAGKLVRPVQRLPDSTVVATIVRHRAAEFTSVNAVELRQLLRDRSENRVVITEEPDSYVLRLVPPLVCVRQESKLFRSLKNGHPGGMHIFDKDAVDRLLAQLNADDVVGELMTKDQTWSPEDVTAARLLEWLRESAERVRVWEQDHSWYLLEFCVSTAPQVPRLLAVYESSPLVTELRRLQKRCS